MKVLEVINAASSCFLRLIKNIFSHLDKKVKLIISNYGYRQWMLVESLLKMPAIKATFPLTESFLLNESQAELGLINVITKQDSEQNASWH